MTISRTLAGMCSKVLWRCPAGVLAGCVAGVILSLSTGQVGHALKVYPPAPFLAAGAPASRCGPPVVDLGPTHPLVLSKIRYFAY